MERLYIDGGIFQQSHRQGKKIGQGASPPRQYLRFAAKRKGAAYPASLKWITVQKASRDSGKYFICNADEGDSDAFMDRSVLESDRAREGMAITALRGA